MSCSKVRFQSGAKARAAEQTIRRRGVRITKKPARAYYCEHCHGWHLTSEPR